jgi:hypothetical protein
MTVKKNIQNPMMAFDRIKDALDFFDDKGIFDHTDDAHRCPEHTI